LTRESDVSRPSFFNCFRSSALNSTSARAMPRRTAPAWPLMPPPATVAGGGVNSSSGAVRLGIARALVRYNAELRKQLKKDGLLTSDSRVKERKKYGLAGARKRFQFSKR
jgi:hypothetical protein